MGSYSVVNKRQGHNLAKFYARLGWKQEAVQAVALDKCNPGERTYATAGPTSQYPQGVTVQIADTWIDKCGLGVAVVSMIGTLAGVIVTLALR